MILEWELKRPAGRGGGAIAIGKGRICNFLVVCGFIPTLSCYVYIAACNQMKIVSLKIAGGQEMATTMALPHLLTPEGQEETSAMLEHADVLAE